MVLFQHQVVNTVGVIFNTSIVLTLIGVEIILIGVEAYQLQMALF